jgi:SOS-response transcriptional repressor LexA
MNIANRVKEKRVAAGLSQTALAKKAGIKQPSLSAIENGTAMNIRASTLSGLAKALGVNKEWLENGATKISTNNRNGNANIIDLDNTRIGLVPVVSMVQAGDFTEATDPYAAGEGSEPLPCPYPHGDNTFAVTIRGESMLPEFKEGLAVFIDPSQMPENKDYCVAKLTDTNEATFKQYVIEDGKVYLKAVNPDWPDKYIPINGDCHIVGKLIGVYQAY